MAKRKKKTAEKADSVPFVEVEPGSVPCRINGTRSTMQRFRPIFDKLSEFKVGSSPDLLIEGRGEEGHRNAYSAMRSTFSRAMNRGLLVLPKNTKVQIRTTDNWDFLVSIVHV